MQVHDGDNNNLLGINAIQNAIRKPFNETTAYIGGNF